ncbi:exodeoxyribonuclease III [Advenella sp. RU8]|uniref:exodeoxyribonuclease III n=1 Tax=Advenella sp. RU8 TaxID=3399575 RepID=UPI003AAD336B
MKIATWNVNSLKVRLPQVIAWLQENPVDALCLQELKQETDKFPLDAFKEMGYHCAWTGQKTYNGVAIISRQEPVDITLNNPFFTDEQQRLVSITVPSSLGDIRLICAYCPNGSSLDSDKYAYKLEWFKALHQYLQQQLEKYPNLAILGDYNVAPEDRDAHDKYSGDILVSPSEREAFQRLINLGLSDAFRLFEQEEKSFSWWDYRMMGFRRNAGLRIDHILLSKPLRDLCTGCVIDKQPRRNEQPSDHTPVVATLEI